METGQPDGACCRSTGKVTDAVTRATHGRLLCRSQLENESHNVSESDRRYNEQHMARLLVGRAGRLPRNNQRAKRFRANGSSRCHCQTPSEYRGWLSPVSPGWRTNSDVWAAEYNRFAVKWWSVKANWPIHGTDLSTATGSELPDLAPSHARCCAHSGVEHEKPVFLSVRPDRLAFPCTHQNSTVGCCGL